jgi:hypothetical protein
LRAIDKRLERVKDWGKKQGDNRSEL